jgi:hypothetical protein
MSAFLDYVLLSLLFVAGFASVAFFAMGVGYRRGRRDEAALVEMREVGSPDIARPAKVRSHVFMFQRRFVPLIVSGVKCTTIRPVGKRREVHAGDLLSLRCWSGLPYRSPQTIIGTAIAGESAEMLLDDDGIRFHSHAVPRSELNMMAAWDGFADWREMLAWFAENHALPFSGLMFSWHDFTPAQKGGAR